MSTDAPKFKLGRFEILRELGRGAFGTVYLARDPQLERSVALKVPNLRFQSRPVHAERFLQEARAAAGLHHPNIVPIHDAGQLAEHYYIAAAYIEGGTLRDIMRSSGRPSTTTAARIVARLADALGYAHAKGVVHRDVKPENILLDSDGTPYLTDFGLARRLQDEADAQKKSLFGTPGYMSPEQAAGRGASADGHSDQWALGVILYELLTEKRPFEGEPLSVLYAIQHTEPAPLRTHVPDLPLDLQAICLKCLSKQAQQRYADCYELAHDLERWLNDEPVQARPLTLPQRLARWSRREPLIARLASMFLITITAFSILLTMLWIRAEQSRMDARAKVQEAKQSNQLLEAQTQDLLKTQNDLKQNNLRLDTAVGELDKKVLELQKLNARLTESETTIQKQLADLKASKEQTAQAQQDTASEQAKNRKLRYIGDILAAGFAISARQNDRALSILNQTNPDERSIEWNFLKKQSESRDNQYQLIADFSQSPLARNFSLPSLHFPATATDNGHAQALMNSTDILAISADSKRWLTIQGTADVLQRYLPEGQHQPRDPRYPNGPRLNLLNIVATEFGEKAILAREQASHAWLSPDGRFACFMVPDIQVRQIDADDLVITIRFQLALLDLEAAKPERHTLIQPDATYIDLKIRRLAVPDIGPAYTLEIPDLSVHFDGAFSPDSDCFVLFNAQNKQLNKWSLADWSENSPARKTVATVNLQNVISKQAVPSACRYAESEFQLSVLGQLLACDPATLKVNNQVTIPIEEAVPEAIAFSHSGQHVAQIYSQTDARRNTSLLLRVLNCETGNDDLLSLSARELETCSAMYAFSDTAAGRLLEAGRRSLLTIDWHRVDFVDDIDAQWFSFRLPPHTQFYFEKPRASEELARLIWRNPNKQRPRFIKAQAANRLLLGYPDRVVVLQRQDGSQNWDVLRAEEFKDEPLVDGQFHLSQNSLVLSQRDRLSILGLAAGAKPQEFSLPFKSSLCMLSERSLAFINQAGQLQLASAIDGTPGNTYSIDRLGSSCLAADLKHKLLAIGSTERKLGVFSLYNRNVVQVVPTREPLEALMLNGTGTTLGAVGLNGHVAVYAWPSLQRKSVLTINDEILMAMPTNDGKRLLLVTPNEFQIIDNEYAVRILDGQKFAVPLVAATVSTDQSEVFVYNRDGQLLGFKL